MMINIFADDTLGQDIPHVAANPATLDAILNTIYIIAGALAVVFIIIGGIRYILSAGDSSNLTKAKNTILYAVLGLIVTIMAFAITNFVIASLNFSSFDNLRSSVVNTLFYAAGAIAVIVIVYGAFKYVTSTGDSSKITSAKNTILSAVIGLVIVILAFAIVNFVIANV